MLTDFVTSSYYASLSSIPSILDIASRNKLSFWFCIGVNKPAVTSAIRDASHLTELVTRKNSMELRNETQAATANEGMQPLFEFH